MKLTLGVLTFLLAINFSYGAGLECNTLDTSKESSALYIPRFRLSANVPDSTLQKEEIKTITDAKATAGTTMKEVKLNLDTTYLPRGKRKDLNRFSLNPNLLWDSDGKEIEDKDFEKADGWIHYVILPKTAGERNNKGIFVLSGILAYTTDSYHDGIISYTPMTCTLAQ